MIVYHATTRLTHPPVRCLFFLVGLLVFFAVAGPVNAGQWLLGTVSITDLSGVRQYGSRLSVFVTREALPVPREPNLADLERHRRLERINQLHMTFFKAFSRQRTRPGFILAHTETSATGNFAFFNLPAGRYYLVVTVPAMISGFKVAWQQPVVIAAGRMAYVSLDRDNLALPTDRRR